MGADKGFIDGKKVNWIRENMVKILLFTEGTIIMHKGASGHKREDIVKQVKNKEKTVHEYESYIPIGNAVQKLKKWKESGAEIFYLTSRKKPEEVAQIQRVLQDYDFPDGKLLHREENEEYCNVAEKCNPNILIEDDCESIGGTDEMTITPIKPEIKRTIKSIPIKEFGGIDHLPDRPENL
ncbi:MAG: hypothetical protein JXA43_02450 [Candidatus Diapherotrites archaeon]|nr:hypothetical protein [Candidatus Diapherotrites archaeon]